MNGSSSAPAVQPAARMPSVVPSSDLKRRAPAEAEQPNKAPKLTLPLVPAPRSKPPAKVNVKKANVYETAHRVDKLFSRQKVIV